MRRLAMDAAGTPSMRDTRFERIDGLLHEVLALPADKRDPFLASACRDDPVLLQHLRALLDEEHRTGILDVALPELAATVMIARPDRLAPGRMIGPYEVIEWIGAGGMGEVYLARDIRLHRNVAVKVLARTFRSHEEPLARLTREAQVLASLSHPNIGAIFAVEEFEGAVALVLEFLPGPTLADLVARGPLPPLEALHIAEQVAAGLEAAHGLNVIHRDVKPANIKVATDGTVKILDFGIARVLEDATIERPASSSTPRSLHHTVDVAGTPAYMSPEQVRGLPVGAHTDVWAFGCLVYQMLVGRAPFAADSVPETLTAIVNREPDWSALPVTTSRRLLHLLRACLAKAPAARVSSVAVARYVIRQEITMSAEEHSSSPATRTNRLSRRALWGLLAAACAVVVFAGWRSWTASAREDPVRLTLQPPTGVRLADVPYPVAITSDGKRLVFTGLRDGVQQLFVRDLDSLDVVPIPGTEHGDPRAVLSPDGEWLVLADLAAGTLRKFRLDGGDSQILATLPPRPDGSGFRGAAWGSRGTVVFAAEPFAGLMIVPEQGGTPVAITSPPPGEIHGRPRFLPDGRHLLFTRRLASGGDDIVVFDIDRRELRPLRAGVSADYVTSGHLLFIDRGALWASRFDIRTHQLVGAEVRVPEPIRVQQPNGPAHFSVSTNGTLVYVRGTGSQPLWSVDMVDKRGHPTPLRNLPPDTYATVRVSPDGRRLALGPDRGGISIFDLDRETLTRVTSVGGSPLWSGDGKRLAFRAAPEGEPRGVFAIAADGSGGMQRLVTSEFAATPDAWLPGGDLLISTARPGSFAVHRDQQVRMSSGDRMVDLPFSETQFDEAHAALSPGGHWLAYQSNRSSTVEVYVERFPETGERVQVSSGGGVEPVWSRDGSRLFYMSADGRQLFEAPVSIGPRIRVGAPRVLFQASRRRPGWPVRGFDVLPDGATFVLVVPDERSVPSPEVVVVQHWFSDLAALVK